MYKFHSARDYSSPQSVAGAKNVSFCTIYIYLSIRWFRGLPSHHHSCINEKKKVLKSSHLVTALTFLVKLSIIILLVDDKGRTSMFLGALSISEIWDVYGILWARLLDKEQVKLFRRLRAIWENLWEGKLNITFQINVLRLLRLETFCMLFFCTISCRMECYAKNKILTWAYAIIFKLAAWIIKQRQSTNE